MCRQAQSEAGLARLVSECALGAKRDLATGAEPRPVRKNKISPLFGGLILLPAKTAGLWPACAFRAIALGCIIKSPHEGKEVIL